MIVPSDVWCNTNGFVNIIDNQGTMQTIPDYKRALQTDPNLLLVIAKMNTLMAERGFPLKDLESTLKTIEQRTAEDNMITSKSGNELKENALDLIKRTAKADIIMQLTYTINSIGPKKSITYNLQAIDAYTNKQIAGEQGTGAQSFSAELPVLLEEAVLEHLDNFNTRLQSYFEDLFANGREVMVDIRVFENDADIDLETEFEKVELAEIIDEWIYQNTQSHRYNKTDGSENFAYYEQVRIPIYKANGAPQDTESFVRELRKFLREKYNVTSKVIPRGLGRASLIIGEK